MPPQPKGLGDYLRRPGEPRLPGIHIPGVPIPGDAWKPPLLGGGNEEQGEAGPDSEQGEQKQSIGSLPLRGRPPVGGLNPDFAHRLVALQHAVRQSGGDLYIFSGARDKQHQMRLFQDALRKYGDEKTAMKYVKLPGKSAHDPQFGLAKGLGLGGLAVDIRGDLHIAHKLAPQFGVEFPHSTHPWHMEMAGISKLKA